MKKPARKPHLTLSTQTLRALQQRELREVGGAVKSRCILSLALCCDVCPATQISNTPDCC